MSDFRVAVRRTNEWDGPSMLKIYTPYVEKTHYTPDTEVPTCSASTPIHTAVCGF